MKALPALITAVVLVAAACSSDTSEDVADATPSSTTEAAATSAPSSTAAPAATETEETAETEQPGDLLDQGFLVTTANQVRVSDGTFMIAVVDQDGVAIEGSTGVDANGNAPVAGDAFRIGSITKVFTSLATLSLVDDGLVDLDAAASDYVTRVPVPDDVTVRDLLRHRTGIFNYTDVPDFFDDLLADPDVVWTPEATVALIDNRGTLTTPGSEFSYSNTNYAILGVLIEEVTGQPYHEALRERILDPLGLTSTYVAGVEDGPEPFDPFVPAGDDGFDYTSIATSAWAAGAIVSSAEDLHALFTALFDGGVLSDELVAEMTAGSFYGLGVELNEWQSGLIGHSGGIPGYFTFVRHSTESGITAFLVSTDEQADTTPAIDAVLDGLASDSEVVVAAEPPRNDLFANSVVIDPSGLPFSDSVDTTGATADDDDVAVGCPAPATDASVWYTITPATDSQLSLSGDGSDYSYGISVATGEAGSFELIECRPFPFTLDATADVTYHLQVFDGQDDGRGNGGNLEFTVDLADPVG